MTIPPHIIEAANLIHEWATENGHKEFVIGNICSTSCINTSHSLVKLYQHYLRTQVDPALLANPPERSEPYEMIPPETPIQDLTPQERFSKMFNHPREGE